MNHSAHQVLQMALHRQHSVRHSVHHLVLVAHNVLHVLHMVYWQHGQHEMESQQVLLYSQQLPFHTVRPVALLTSGYKYQVHHNVQLSQPLVLQLHWMSLALQQAQMAPLSHCLSYPAPHIVHPTVGTVY